MKQGDLVRINIPGRLKHVFRMTPGTTQDEARGVVIQADTFWAIVMVNGRCSGYNRDWLEVIESPP